MTAIEYRTIIRNNATLNRMTQEEIAAMLCEGPRTIRRHLAGRARIGGPTTALMRFIAHGKITVEDVKRVLPR